MRRIEVSLTYCGRRDSSDRLDGPAKYLSLCSAAVQLCPTAGGITRREPTYLLVCAQQSTSREAAKKQYDQDRLALIPRACNAA